MFQEVPRRPIIHESTTRLLDPGEPAFARQRQRPRLSGSE
jgi:hypothetical protein